MEEHTTEHTQHSSSAGEGTHRRLRTRDLIIGMLVSALAFSVLILVVGLRSGKQKAVSPEAFVPAVVQLHCSFQSAEEYVQGGSGISFANGTIQTNAHVVRMPSESDPVGERARGCMVYFPTATGKFYERAYWAGKIDTYDDTTAIIDGQEISSLDFAILTITEPVTTEDNQTFLLPKPHPEGFFPDIEAISARTCPNDRSPVELGEPIFILGYPSIGGPDMTITEGIVSGFEGELNQFVKTSAKIEEGNSGGIAVSARDGCSIGIPSLSVSGEFESIPRILTHETIYTYLEHLQ